MFDFCAICMVKKDSLIQMSTERLSILEAIVSPSMSLDCLKSCCPLLICLNCNRLVTLTYKFQQNVFNGMTNLITLQKLQKEMSRHDLPEFINGQCDLLLPVVKEETVYSSDVHFARPVFRRIAAKRKPEDILYCTENLINILPALGFSDAKVGILPENAFNTLEPPVKENGRRMPATKRKIAILVRKKISTHAQPHSKPIYYPSASLSLESERERDKYSDVDIGIRPKETMSCESDFDNPDTASRYEQVVATSSMIDHWYGETKFDNPNSRPLERTVAASRMNSHKHADFDNPDTAPVCNNTADMAELVPIKIARRVKPSINSIKLSEVTKAKGIGQLHKAFFALEVRSKLEPVSSKPALESTHALDSKSTHVLDSFSTHEIGKKSTHVLDSNSKHELNLKSTHELDSILRHELSKKSTHVLDSNSKHELNLKSTHELDSKSTHVLNSFLIHELSKKWTHVLESNSKQELNSKSTHEPDSKSTHVLDSFSTHELGKITTHVPNSKSTHELDLFSTHALSKNSTHVLASNLKHELNLKSPHELDSKSTHDLDSMSTQDIDSLSTHDIDSESTLSCQSDYEDAERFPNIMFAKAFNCISEDEKNDMSEDIYNKLHVVTNPPSEWPCTWERCYLRHTDEEYCSDDSDDSESTRSNAKWASGRRSKECKLCDKTFASLYHLWVHYEREHVEICLKECCNGTELKNHTKRRLKVRDFSCLDCGLEARTSFQLNLHLATQRHRLKSQWRFQCDICKKKFEDKKGIAEHIEREHVAKEANTCPMCSVAFRSARALHKHAAAHILAQEARARAHAHAHAHAPETDAHAHTSANCAQTRKRRILTPGEDSTLTNGSIQKRPRKQKLDLSNERELTQDPGNARGNSRTQYPGNARVNSRTQNLGNTRSNSQTQNPRNTRSNSQTQNTGKTRSNSRTQNAGNARKPTQNAGNARNRTQNARSVRRRRATRKVMGDEEYADGRTDERVADMMEYLKTKTWVEAAEVLDFLKRQV